MPDDRAQLRQLIHDTVAQTLFAASTLSGVLVSQFKHSTPECAHTAQELDILIKDAVSELQAIQQYLEEPDHHGHDE